MAEAPDIPEALPARRPRFSIQLVWLVPLLAIAIGVWLAVKTYLDQGPVITVAFRTAEGIEPGKTKVRYRDLEVGQVRSVILSAQGVIVTVDMVRETEKRLVEDTRFWVVRPRIAGGNVTGLGTLLAGAHIAVDPGSSARQARNFVGLEYPPASTSDVPGRRYTLRSRDAGSLGAGSPVLYRRVQVGQVASRQLDEDGKGVTLTVFVNAPFDRFVTADSRFWHASGLEVSLGAGGFKIDTQGLVALAIGGIAFSTPDESLELPPADGDALFMLHPGHAEAMKQPDRVMQTYLLSFRQSVRGLSVGAPVDYRGIVLGEVSGIYLQSGNELPPSMVVQVQVFPERLLERRLKGANEGPPLQKLVDAGLRAQLRTGSLVTGQLYVALDYFPDAPKFQLDLSESPAEFPTVPGSLEDLQQTLASVARKIEQVPFDKIGGDLRRTLKTLDTLATRIDKQILPQTVDTLEGGKETLAALRSTLADASRTLSAAERTAAPDSALQHDIRDAVREIARTAQTLRTLADYLERHPEALLRGKREDPK